MTPLEVNEWVKQHNYEEYQKLPRADILAERYEMNQLEFEIAMRLRRKKASDEPDVDETQEEQEEDEVLENEDDDDIPEEDGDIPVES